MIFSIIYLGLFVKKFVFFGKIGGVYVIVKVGNIIIEMVIDLFFMNYVLEIDCFFIIGVCIFFIYIFGYKEINFKCIL